MLFRSGAMAAFAAALPALAGAAPPAAPAGAGAAATVPAPAALSADLSFLRGVVESVASSADRSIGSALALPVRLLSAEFAASAAFDDDDDTESVFSLRCVAATRHSRIIAYSFEQPSSDKSSICFDEIEHSESSHE